MFKEKLIIVKEHVKNHVARHQHKYYVGGLIGVSVVTFAVTRRVYLGRLVQLEGTNVFITKAIVKGNGAFYNIYNIYPNGMKNQGLSWMVKCKETGTIFRSQKHASEMMGLSKEQLSSHLNGGRSNVSGYHFERIGVAA